MKILFTKDDFNQFDDADLSKLDDNSNDNSNGIYDDSFDWNSDIEVGGNKEEKTIIPEPPAGFNGGIADMLMSLIKDEYDAIQGYNGAISTLNDFNNCDVIKQILKDIANEENVHVGQLQKALELVAPNATSSVDGRIEANETIMDDSNVLHPGMSVQSADAPIIATPKLDENANDDDMELGEDACTLSDIDDEI